jgi:acyl dehydratase
VIDKNIIGKEFPEISFEIEKGKIREFARAIGDKNPAYYKEEAAKELGLEGLAVPPTFPTVFAMAGGLLDKVAALGVDFTKLLHGGQEYEYLQPIKPGDTVTGKTVIANVFEKSGKAGTMDLIVYETTYTNQVGQKVLVDKSRLDLRR